MAKTRAEYKAYVNALCSRCEQPRWKHDKWAPRETRISTCEDFQE